MWLATNIILLPPLTSQNDCCWTLIFNCLFWGNVISSCLHLKLLTVFFSETFSFVLTGEDGSRWFGYCKKLLVSPRLVLQAALVEEQKSQTRNVRNTISRWVWGLLSDLCIIKKLVKLCIFILFMIYFLYFFWLHWVLVAARRILVVACGLFSSCGTRVSL